jgi:DNA polymerase-1
MKMDETFLRYNALDSACMVQIHDAIWPELQSDFQTTYDMTIDLMEVLTFMQTRGMRVSHDLLNQTKKDVLASTAVKQEELNKLVGRELNVNSSKDCATYFYIELGIPPYKGKTGAITCDDLAMQRLARGTAQRPGLRQAKLVQEIRGLQKLYGTYLNMRFDEDNRMRGSYNPRGTMFGRLSSSKTIFNTGMNFQNLPSEFKKFLIADPGYFLLEIDKRQAEWVVVAYASGDANMISAIEQGIDVHTHTASLMFDCDLDLIKYENKKIGHTTDAELIFEIRQSDEILRKMCSNFPRTMSARQCGKRSNHGLNYGEGYRQFALINEIEEREAKKVVAMYHQIYPGIGQWHESIQRQLGKGRTLENCFGRRVRFLGQWNDSLFKSAYSMLPQSTVVDGLNQGMVKIYKDKWIVQYQDIDILAQVHDSILLQVPLSFLSKRESFIKFLSLLHDYTSPLMEYNQRPFKIASDIKCGLNWGEYSDNNKNGMQDVTDYESINKLLGVWEFSDGNQS